MRGRGEKTERKVYKKKEGKGRDGGRNKIEERNKRQKGTDEKRKIEKEEYKKEA